MNLGIRFDGIESPDFRGTLDVTVTARGSNGEILARSKVELTVGQPLAAAMKARFR